MRRRQAGELVTYVVNRNINFTNVCIKHCTFCAFSRDHREEEGYFLPLDEVVRRAIEAWEMGATEVCIQAGLPPKLDGHYYIDLCRAIKAAVPEMHLHAFSPEEVLYGSTRAGLSIPEYLKLLRAAGLGTLPGTSAEILDQEIRDIIAKGRITVPNSGFGTSRKIPEEVFKTGELKIVADLLDGDLANVHMGTVALGIRNVQCVPLKLVRYVDRADDVAGERRIGVLYLDSREKGTFLSGSTRGALETLATEAAVAIENARLYRETMEKAKMEQEMRIAADIQQALLPKAGHAGAFFRTAASSLP